MVVETTTLDEGARFLGGIVCPPLCRGGKGEQETRRQ